MTNLDSRQTSSATLSLKPGDVVSYLRERDHAREGTAYVRENVLTAEELATAEVRFNANDYERLDPYAATSRAKWETYHSDDRGRISSQHGLQEVLFLRRGAKPHLGTQIENARRRVELAESGLRTAEWWLECRRQELAELESGA